MTQCSKRTVDRVIGIDLGDQVSQFYVLGPDREGEETGSVTMTRAAFRKQFSRTPCRVVIEAGAQSAWVSEELEQLGHEAIVANPRRVRLIYGDVNKGDAMDAEKLARLGAYDLKLLSPIEHRGAAARTDLAVIRAREILVSTRAKVINHVRSSVKHSGDRLPSCSSEAFARKAAPCIPDELRPALHPLLEIVAELTCKIREYDGRIEELAAEKYPETEQLRQVTGVGSLTSLAYVLTLEDARRFK